MQLKCYLDNRQIIELKSKRFDDAINELLQLCPLSKKFKKPTILKQILAQESLVSTYLGNGIAMPHARLPIKKPYIITLGMSREGITSEFSEFQEKIHIVVLLLSSENDPNQLTVLANLAKIFHNDLFAKTILETPSLSLMRKTIFDFFDTTNFQVIDQKNRLNQLLLKSAVKLAHTGQCTGIMVFCDTFERGIDFRHLFKDSKVFLISEKFSEVKIQQETFTLPVPAFSKNRFAQLRSAIVIGLTHGILKAKDRLCCIGGLLYSNQLDILSVIEVEKEVIFSKEGNFLPSTINPEVLERLLAISIDLAIEGREGKPVGCLFVLGNISELKPFLKPLVLNPFYGYSPEDRNLLNPFMAETLKEFALLDGAVVIGTDGTLESAGTLVNSPAKSFSLPSGLGTRHAAAASISLAADCIAITISSSTRQISLFRRGEMLTLLDKGV